MNDTLQTMMTASDWTRVRVRGKPEQIDEVLNRLESLPPGWSRDKEREEMVRKIQKVGEPLFVFVYQPKPETPVVSIVLGQTQSDLLRGGQWVPLTQDYQVAECAVAKFLTTIFQPVVNQAGLIVDFTGGSPIDFYFSGNARESLENFVGATASPDTPLGPEDRQRWNAFLIVAQRSGSGASPEELEDWLKDRGFPPERAKELCNQYDFGFQLLEDYEQARNSAW